MGLERKQNNLRKAQARFDKVSKRTKQFQIEFVREQNKNGKFKTNANIVRSEKQFHGNNRGLLHKAANAKYRIKGDAPSITRSINAWKPKTKKGKFVKGAAVVTNFAVHDVKQTAVDTALAAETVGIKGTDVAWREVRNKLKQKYTREAVDDYHRGVFFVGRTAVDAVKGTHSHFKQKKQAKLEKAKYSLQKAEYRLFKVDSYKPKLKASKADIKSAKALYKSKIVKSKKNPYRRAMNKRRKQAFLQSKRELRFEQKQLKTDKRFKKKELANQRKIKRNASAGLLVLKPVSYSAERMRASVWQKAVNEDQDNDFLHAADSAKRRVADPIKDKTKQNNRLHRQENKRDRLSDEKAKSNKKLNKQENKLNDRHDKYKQRKKKRKPKNKKGKKSVSDTIRSVFKFVKNVYTKEVKKFFGSIAVPVIIILLVFAFIIMIFSSIASSSGFTLGTYAAQDYDLSEAEKYYTELAYNLNKKILKVSDTSNWKNGLADFGANKRDLKDTPDNWYWGRSSVYDWDPVYDFDCYKLWSFLCAYYYDFDAADNGDIKYWSFTNSTKTLLEEIFNDEYEFVYWYDNQSRWEELSPYNYWGGGKADLGGTYYKAEKDAYIYDGEPYRYRFKPIAITSELSKYEDSEGYICINSNYRVLDPNDEYALTGFYVMDHRYYSGEKRPFYYVDNDAGVYYFLHGGTRYNRSFWGWDGEDAWFLVSPTDTHIWNSGLSDVCMYGYYEKYQWKTDCNLYYNVNQKKTFDEVIEDKLSSMSNSTERLQYYNLLVGNEDGNTLYGNHQTLYNLLPESSIRDYSLKREFGYEMTGWNNASDGLYQGIKVYADSGTKLKMPFKGKITNVDTSDNKITIRKDDVQYWYDGTGGTKRDTEVTIANAKLLSGFENGDTVDEGVEFAKTTAGNVNFHIYIDTDGWGWDYIDPRLVLY